MRVAFLGNFTAPWCTEQHWAGSFELVGHQVTRIQEGHTKALSVPELARGHDLFVWVQTYSLAVEGGTIPERRQMLKRLHRLGIPTVGLHLDRWWGLNRADQITTEPWFEQDFVMTADGGHDTQFRALGINHHWLPPGVYEPECVTGTHNQRYARDIAFVGSWQGGYHQESRHRFELVEWLRANYGRRVGFWPRNRQIRGRDLSDLYASAKIIVGDSCMLPGDPGYYWSDRIPETLGRGGFLLHPNVVGLDEHFTDGAHLRTWTAGDWDELRGLIDHYVGHAEERAQIRGAGMEHVRQHHTYTRRVQQVLEIVGGRSQQLTLDALLA